VAGCKCQIVHPRFDRRSAATSWLAWWWRSTIGWWPFSSAASRECLRVIIYGGAKKNTA
jgi:hypothetical protein